MLLLYVIFIFVGVALMSFKKDEGVPLLCFYLGGLLIFLVGFSIMLSGFPFASTETISETAPYYGEMYYHNDTHTATTIKFDDADTYYTFFFTDADIIKGFTYTGGFNTDSYLVTNNSGIYRACYLASGSGTNNHNYYTTIFLNDTVQEKCESHKKLTAGGDILTMNGCCLLEITSGDVIRLKIRDIDTGGQDTGDYYSANLNLNSLDNVSNIVTRTYSNSYDFTYPSNIFGLILCLIGIVTIILKGVNSWENQE